MKVINCASKRDLLRSNAAGKQVSRKKSLYIIYIFFIYIGIYAIIKTLKIDEDGTKTNFDNSLLEWFMLRSHAAEKNICFKNKFWSVSSSIYG